MIALPDLSKMIYETLSYVYSIHSNEFLVKGESFLIGFDGIQSTRYQIRMIFGPLIADLFFEFHEKFQSLRLNENELALFYPFTLTSLDRKYI